MARKRREARDKARADRVIAFIEKLIVPSGEGQGAPFRLDKFQIRFIRAIYEPQDPRNQRRLVRRAILSIARKNGKTALIAALVLVHLIGPEAIQNGEIYSAANDRDQAAQVFKVARQIVEADPELQALIKVVASTKTLTCALTGSFYRAISAEAGSKHGLNPTVVIYDELAQSKNRDLFDALDTAMGARQEPLFIVISTQSNDPLHIMSQLVDDGISANDPAIVCHLYEVPEEEESIWTTRAWRMANPALGTFRSVDDLRALARRAQRMPSFEPAFRNLYLNQRVAPVSTLISRKDWFSCASPEMTFQQGEEIYLGLDLSSVIDLSALVMASAVDGDDRIRPFFWKPEDLLKEHSDRDFGSGNRRYVEWNEAGHLLTTPGRSIHPRSIALFIAELSRSFRIKALAFDRWRIDMLLREFEEIGLIAQKGDEGDGLRLEPWGQGWGDMGPAVDAFELAVMDRTLAHESNPVLNWNIANAIVITDPAGNRKMDKDKARFRIDGAVAAAMALGIKARDLAKAEPPSVYKSRGLVAM